MPVIANTPVSTPDVRYPYRAVAIDVSSDDANLAADFPVGCTELYIGSSGDVSAQLTGDGDAVVYTAVPKGTTLYGNFIKVTNANTTASDIVARGK